MINFIDTLIIVIVLSLVWLLYTWLIMFHIKYTAKKKLNKNKEAYSYFHYPFYKKLFLLGLKGCLSTSIVISTFILNISVLLLLSLGIWHLISPNIYLAYCLRIIVGIYGISFFLKLLLYLCIPPKF